MREDRLLNIDLNYGIPYKYRLSSQCGNSLICVMKFDM